MSKHPDKNFVSNIKPTSFVAFWSTIGADLPEGMLVLRDRPKSTEALFATRSNHSDLLREVILGSYAACKCDTVDDAIDINTVLDLMGDAAFNRQMHNTDDLLDIEMLEEIAYLICLHFGSQIVYPQSRYLDKTDTNKFEKSSVVSIEKAKIHFANRQL